jgi:hypothetical protein
MLWTNNWKKKIKNNSLQLILKKKIKRLHLQQLKVEQLFPQLIQAEVHQPEEVRQPEEVHQPEEVRLLEEVHRLEEVHQQEEVYLQVGEPLAQQEVQPDPLDPKSLNQQRKN